MRAPHPWSTNEAGFAWLRRIADVAAGVATGSDAGRVEGEAIAKWALDRDLVAPAYAWAGRFDPALADRLRSHALGAAAANLLHRRSVEDVERRFAAAGIGMVLLKGAATGDWAYRDPSMRPMTDVDVWVAPSSMDAASVCLLEAGYRRDPGLAARPDALQRESGGERIFLGSGGGSARVELHWSPFQGWWTRRTAAPDADAAWSRAVPISPGRHARRLAAEDAVIQASVHAVVGQFSQAPLRGLLDVAVIARRVAVDWEAVASRARRWRLRVGVWLVLDAADRLFHVPGAAGAIDRLRPGAARCAFLRRFAGPEALLRGAVPRSFHGRHAFLLAVTDRPRDAARLVGRTIWPEPWWLEARYGRRRSRLGHLRAMIREGGA